MNQIDIKLFNNSEIYCRLQDSGFQTVITGKGVYECMIGLVPDLCILKTTATIDKIQQLFEPSYFRFFGEDKENNSIYVKEEYPFSDYFTFKIISVHDIEEQYNLDVLSINSDTYNFEQLIYFNNEIKDPNNVLKTLEDKLIDLTVIGKENILNIPELIFKPFIFKAENPEYQISQNIYDLIRQLKFVNTDPEFLNKLLLSDSAIIDDVYKSGLLFKISPSVADFYNFEYKSPFNAGTIGHNIINSYKYIAKSLPLRYTVLFANIGKAISELSKNSIFPEFDNFIQKSILYFEDFCKKFATPDALRKDIEMQLNLYPKFLCDDFPSLKNFIISNGIENSSEFYYYLNIKKAEAIILENEIGRMLLEKYEKIEILFREIISFPWKTKDIHITMEDLKSIGFKEKNEKDIKQILRSLIISNPEFNNTKSLFYYLQKFYNVGTRNVNKLYFINNLNIVSYAQETTDFDEEITFNKEINSIRKEKNQIVSRLKEYDKNELDSLFEKGVEELTSSEKVKVLEWQKDVSQLKEILISLEKQNGLTKHELDIWNANKNINKEEVAKKSSKLMSDLYLDDTDTVFFAQILLDIFTPEII